MMLITNPCLLCGSELYSPNSPDLHENYRSLYCRNCGATLRRSVGIPGEKARKVAPGAQYTLSEDLTFGPNASALPFFKGTWSQPPQPWGRWTTDDYAGLSLPMRHPARGATLLSMTGRRPAGVPPLAVVVVVQNVEVARWSFAEPGPVDKQIALSTGLLRGHPHVDIDFYISSVTGSDRTILENGLGVQRLSLSEQCHINAESNQS